MKANERRALLPEETYTVSIQRDVVTGIVVFEHWGRGGLTDREDGPAVVVRDGATGVVLHESWYKKSKPHRVNGPAAIRRRLDGRTYYTAWYRDGEKIAPPKPTREPRLARQRPSKSHLTGPSG